jgi:hypothetical protein
MNEPTFARLSDLFAKSSATFQKANPHIFDAKGKKNVARGNVERKRGAMNTTERDFSLILEAQKRKGEILRYEFQGMTLRWPVGNEIVKYTPDFVVFAAAKGLPEGFIHTKLIEVKGGYRKFPGYLERAIERYRHAKTYWPQFQFELWKKEKSGWIRKI